MATGKEIERKYLVGLVESQELHRKSTISRIEQTYLLATEGERRIRKRITDNNTEFFYTEKFGTGLTRQETEKKISEEDYIAYLSEADPKLHSIKKYRYTFFYNNQCFELDVYDFCKTYATLEIELQHEDQNIELPSFIHVIREVTEDKRFKNRQLAESLKLPV